MRRILVAVAIGSTLLLAACDDTTTSTAHGGEPTVAPAYTNADLQSAKQALDEAPPDGKSVYVAVISEVVDGPDTARRWHGLVYTRSGPRLYESVLGETGSVDLLIGKGDLLRCHGDDFKKYRMIGDGSCVVVRKGQ